MKKLVYIGVLPLYNIKGLILHVFKTVAYKARQSMVNDPSVTPCDLVIF